MRDVCESHLVRDECWSVILFFLAQCVPHEADRWTHENLHLWLWIANELLRIQSTSVLSCFPVYSRTLCGSMAFAGD
jgi:hypothetical protein